MCGRKLLQFLEHRVVYRRADDGESSMYGAALSKPHGTDCDCAGYNPPPELRDKLRHYILTFLEPEFYI